MPSTTPTIARNGPLPPVVAWTRAIAVGSVVALIVLGLVWELWLAPTGSGWLALKVVPLALPLAGLMRNRLYTYRWVTLFVWLYFIEGVVRAVSDRGVSAWLAMIEVALTVALFIACVVHVRCRLGHAAAVKAAA
ncbi:MAG: DUF2069 domain-containing protein [Burkholderiales bacterium]